MEKNKAKTVSEALHDRELGLGEVRAKLIDSIETLKSVGDLSKIDGKQLKDFWSKDYPPAPFEEVFTIKQITDINIDTFFKKRSVMPSKILGIIAAIDNAIASAAIHAKKTQPTSKANKAKAAPIAAATGSQKKIRSMALQYNMLISKCQLIIDTLNLAEDSKDFESKNKKLLATLASDIKKIDKILSANHSKLSKQI